MKNYLILFSLCLLVGSCIDSDYDLSKLGGQDEQEIVIGNDESEFRMPLANINFSVESFNQSGENGEISITDLVDEIRIWLPTQMPGGVDYLEIERLITDSGYLNSILTALIEEMNESEQKRNEVCYLIAKKYRMDILDLLYGIIPDFLLGPIEQMTDEQAGDVIAALYVSFNDVLAEAIKSLSTDFLLDLEIDNIIFDIPSMNVSDEIYDMLTDNLDAPDVADPVNALYLYGTIESELPISLSITPYMVGATINFGKVAVAEGENPINEVRIDEDDLFELFNSNSLKMVIPIKLERYYYKRDVTDDQEVDINLKLRKTGGLAL